METKGRTVGNEEFSILCKAALDSVLECNKNYDCLVFNYLKNRLEELDDKTIYEMYSDMSDVNYKHSGIVNPRKQINGWWTFYKELQKEKECRDRKISKDTYVTEDNFNEILGYVECAEYDEGMYL